MQYSEYIFKDFLFLYFKYFKINVQMTVTIHFFHLLTYFYLL